MVTKKTEAPAKAPVKKTVKKVEPQYAMPKEVKDWIEQADSRLKFLQGQVESLKEENAKLKSWRTWAEKQILGQSSE